MMKFEEALQRLEKTVEQLEAGDVALEQALELFETGITMSRLCAKQLDEAEQRIDVLLNVSEDGEPQTAPFDAQNLDA